MPLPSITKQTKHYPQKAQIPIPIILILILINHLINLPNKHPHNGKLKQWEHKD